MSLLATEVVNNLPAELLAKGLTLLFSTIFSVIVIWLVIRIWNQDEGGGDKDKNRDASDKPGGKPDKRD